MASMILPPGAPTGHRAVSRVPDRRAATVLALAAALGVVAAVWSSLHDLNQSWGITGPGLTVVQVGEVLLAAAALIVAGVAAIGVRHAWRARTLASLGEYQQARIAAEDAKSMIWYVFGLGLTALIVAFLARLLSANDAAIRATFLRGDILRISNPQLRKGFWFNIKLFCVTEVFVLAWGLIVALARLFPGKAGAPVRFLAVAYTDLFRGMPAVVVIYLVFFGLPLAKIAGIDSIAREQQRFWLPVIALTLVYGAYVAEVYRAGLDSIHWSQTAAARSLGLSHGQTMRYVVVPQAVRRIGPPLLNDFIGLQKDTALCAFVGVSEIFNVSTQLKAKYFNLSPVIGTAIAFIVITIPMARFTDYLIRRDQARMRAGG
jgi:polar amino acid transport system permease protein